MSQHETQRLVPDIRVKESLQSNGLFQKLAVPVVPEK
jgi:hypothetical protein